MTASRREGGSATEGSARAGPRGTGARPRPTVRRDDRPGGPTSPAVERTPAREAVSV